VAFDYEPGIRPKKAANAVTANFTHSQDAAHLHSVTLAAVAENIPMAAIHDCFMCLAPHAKRFNEIIRERFVWLHKEYDWLEAIWEAANEDLSPANRKRLPPLPEKGTLDLEKVKQSFFAFS
jgi:DNA-directed RNA polymerase